MKLCWIGLHKWKELLRNWWRNPWGEADCVGKICVHCRKKVYSRRLRLPVEDCFPGEVIPDRRFPHLENF